MTEALRSKETRLFASVTGGVCRRLRVQKGLTRTDLARQLGIVRASIVKLEAGSHGIALVRYPALARALGVRVMDLLPPEFSKGYEPRDDPRRVEPPSAKDIAAFASGVCRRERRALGLTREAVTKRVGVEPQMLSHIECHAAGILPYRYPLLARALGIRVCDLLPPGFLG